MSEYVYAGLTSQTIDVFLRDSSSASGAGLTGLVFNSSGLKAYYRKGATGSAVQITLATQTTGGAWTSGGFVAVDGTNLPGIYRLDLPDAMVDTEGFVTLHIYGATNLQPTPLRIDCRPLPADLKKIAGSAVNTGAAQIGVNVVSYASGQAPLQPTVAGRTLDVTATGAAGIDWANVENPTTTLALTNTTINTGAIVTAVYAALPADHTVAGSYGARFLLAINSNRTVQVTGSNHVAADIHELQPQVIDATHFAPGAIDANALAADGVAEIQSGLATAANQTILIDGVGFITSVLMGSISDAGTAAETYQIAFGGSTYTVDYSGLDATGNRSTTTRTKT